MLLIVITVINQVMNCDCDSDPRLRGDKTAGQYFRKSALKPDTFEKIGPEYEAVASELWKASEKLTKRKFL